MYVWLLMIQLLFGAAVFWEQAPSVGGRSGVRAMDDPYPPPTPRPTPTPRPAYATTDARP
jgi:hypothetical protein